MYLIPIILSIIALVIIGYIKKTPIGLTVICICLICFMSFVIISIDKSIQCTDKEVWSGKVVDWEHIEEYDKLVTTTSTDSNGNTHTEIHTEHHYATNEIKTTDAGWISVGITPKGIEMDDNYPNSTEELQKMWKYGSPSASVHSYKNKVQASYSIYKHNIDLNKYKDLPNYPTDIKNYIDLNRVVGVVPNKDEAIKRLSFWNTELNKMIPDKENKGKMRSWKQVNIIFVNVGENKSEDYGFALQDYWENGNKNDFLICFSMDKNGNTKWCYPFSWSETEILKIQVRDYMLNQKHIKNFSPIVDDVAKMVADKFERKQFKDFNYLQTNVSSYGMFALCFFNIIEVLVVCTLGKYK